MNEIVLHNYFRSSTSTRVRAALAIKRLQYDYVTWNLRDGAQNSQEFLAINPQGIVPALVIDGQVLTQSVPIIEYLDERFPEPALLPTNAGDRARVRALAAMVACEIHPLNNLRVLRYLKSSLGADAQAQAQWFRHWVHTTFEPLEQMLSSDSRTARFCHGDEPGLADICIFAQVLNNRRFDIEIGDYPTIERIYAACIERPDFAAAIPEVQVDAF